ncbi:MAG: shikimate dehydrogenase [Kiritimatiellae bacterium]|nr:shikimate dehydrogenase [Kiritimatiellia bacterium]
MTDNTNFKKELVGCFGDPIWENPSEAMMEAAFNHHNLKWRYVTTHVPAENLHAAFAGVKAMGYKGFNCTLPHKVAVIEHLDGLGESAEVMGAVNCVVEREGKWIGENTDGKGFVQALEEITTPKGKRVVIFGAGGASRAISVEIALNGATHITIVNRNEERGKEIVAILNEKTAASAAYVKWEGDYALPADTDIVINATCIGLFPNVNDRVAVDATTLTSNMIAADVIPNPPNTPFLREAAATGCTTIDGIGMLVNQGRINIDYWTGVDANPDVMRDALHDVLNLGLAQK